jgi:hypothetical protein
MTEQKPAVRTHLLCPLNIRRVKQNAYAHRQCCCWWSAFSSCSARLEEPAHAALASGEDAKLTVSNQANQGLFAVREGYSVYVLNQGAAGYNLNSKAE